MVDNIRTIQNRSFILKFSAMVEIFYNDVGTYNSNRDVQFKEPTMVDNVSEF